MNTLRSIICDLFMLFFFLSEEFLLVFTVQETLLDLFCAPYCLLAIN